MLKPSPGPSVFALDPGKITLNLSRTPHTAKAFEEALLTKHGLQLEYAQGHLALAMTSLCDEEELLPALAAALWALDQPGPARPVQAFLPPPPVWALTPAEALERPGVLLPLCRSVGRAAGEYVWVYPPGVPLVTPGQAVTEELVQTLADLAADGVTLHTVRDKKGLTHLMAVQ
jgi:arginine/lysine/ornithine decarboxylase